MTLANFSQELKHIKKSTTIAHIKEIVDTSNAFLLPGSAGDTSAVIVQEPVFDINPRLSVSKEQELESLLRRHKE